MFPRQNSFEGATAAIAASASGLASVIGPLGSQGHYGTSSFNELAEHVLLKPSTASTALDMRLDDCCVPPDVAYFPTFPPSLPRTRLWGRTRFALERACELHDASSLVSGSPNEASALPWLFVAEGI